MQYIPEPIHWNEILSSEVPSKTNPIRIYIFIIKKYELKFWINGSLKYKREIKKQIFEERNLEMEPTYPQPDPGSFIHRHSLGRLLTLNITDLKPVLSTAENVLEPD